MLGSVLDMDMQEAKVLKNLRIRIVVSRSETLPNAERRIPMAGKMDQAKGRAKEAAGALTGNQRLKQEGKMDQAAGKIKSAATKTVDAVKNAFSRKKQK